MTESSRVLPYRPDLDGLRGLAVLLVLGFHAFPDLFPGGWLGVDVFFVISGFVIASLIFSQVESGRFSFSEFLRRRIRRLLPALLVVVGAVSIAAWLFLSQDVFAKFAWSAISSVAFLANFFFWRDSGYFDNPPDENPLLHLWSIGVEGQFYLGFPVLILLGFVLGKWRGVGVALIGATLLSVGLGLSGVYAPDTVFYLMPTRAWELLIGALAAWMLTRHPSVAARFQPRSAAITRILVVAGLVAIVSPALVTRSDVYSTVDSVLPTLGALMVVWAGSGNLGPTTVMSWRPLVAVGLVSYSLYLWHWPLLVLGREVALDFSYLDALTSLGLSGVLSYLTWRFVERPFRNRERISWRTARAGILAGAVTVLAFAASVPAGVITAANIEVYRIGIDNYVVGGDQAAEDRWDLVRENSRNLGPGCDHRDFSGWFDPGDRRENLLVVGNSHSRDVFNVLAQSEAVTSQYQVARMGCQLVNMLGHPGLLESETYTSADTVMIASRYSDIDIEALPDIVERLRADGKKIALVAPKGEVALETPESWMWIDNLVYQHQRLAPDLPAIAKEVNADAYPLVTETLGAYAAEIDLIASEYGVPVLERLDYICDDRTRSCTVVSDSLEKYYYDGDHHSLEGARVYAERIEAVNWLGPLTSPPRGS